MIDGKAETMEEWYENLQKTVDDYDHLISNLPLPLLNPQEPVDTFDAELKKYNDKIKTYITAQKPSKYYLELREKK